MSSFALMTTAHLRSTCCLGTVINRIGIKSIGIGCIVTAPLHAEWYLDLSAGAAIAQDDTLDGSNGSLRGRREQHFDPSWELGLRLGRWFPHARWFGISTDWSIFEAENRVLEDNLVNTWSTQLTFRLPPLESEDYPDGKLQPYFGVGPGLFVSDAEADSLTVPGGMVKDVTADPGLDTRLGLAWMIERHFSAFCEYRFTYFRARYEDFKIASGREDTIKAEFATHHILIGLSYRF